MVATIGKYPDFFAFLAHLQNEIMIHTVKKDVFIITVIGKQSHIQSHTGVNGSQRVSTVRQGILGVLKNGDPVVFVENARGDQLAGGYDQGRKDLLLRSLAGLLQLGEVAGIQMGIVIEQADKAIEGLLCEVIDTGVVGLGNAQVSVTAQIYPAGFLAIVPVAVICGAVIANQYGSRGVL